MAQKKQKESSQIGNPDHPLEERIVDTLKTVYDPEIPVDIYELGLIYAIEIDADGAAQIRMTLTSPGCPVAGSLPIEVESKVAAIPGISSVKVDLVWDPPWDMDMISEVGKLQLGIY
jgi:FeS assembly SUF system protein